MKKYLMIVWAIMMCGSCQTYRTIVPAISGSQRSDFTLKKPIVISLKDSRISSENSQQVIESLKFGLKTIYGNNIIFKPYFGKTAEQSIAIKINIKEIGSNFEIRTLQYQTYANQITAVSSSVSTYWGSAVSTAIVSQPVIRDNFVVQGYWVGTSYLDISLVDNLHEKKEIYEFPFVGEDTQNNTWGYKSASIAAQNSWEKVSSHLLDLIDAIAMKIIETE
jgi:hypothetical protein